MACRARRREDLGLGHSGRPASRATTRQSGCGRGPLEAGRPCAGNWLRDWDVHRNLRGQRRHDCGRRSLQRSTRQGAGPELTPGTGRLRGKAIVPTDFCVHVPDETAFIRWNFARKLRSMGFEDVAITPFDWLHPHTPPSLIAAVRAVGKAIESIPLCREFSGSLYIRGRRPS